VVIVSQTVNTSPRTKFKGSIEKLHKAARRDYLDEKFRTAFHGYVLTVHAVTSYTFWGQNLAVNYKENQHSNLILCSSQTKLQHQQ